VSIVSIVELIMVYKRWYKTRLWKDLREIQLQKNPICTRCGEVATVVNHRVPHRGDWMLFNNPDNLESVCKRCHDSVIQREEIRGYGITVDLDGWPIDRKHPHWRVK